MKNQPVRLSHRVFPALLFLLFFYFHSLAQSGTHLHFDGADDRVAFSSTINQALSGTNTITVEAWVRPANTNGNGVIVGNYAFPNDVNDKQFLLRRDGNRYHFSVNDGTGANNEVFSTATVTVNAWQHIAGVWNGSDIRIYVNGVLSGTRTGVTGSGFPPNASNTMVMGTSRAAGGENYAGDIDEVRIWSTAETVDNILLRKDFEIYGAAPGLLRYYRFNQGIGGGNNTGVGSLLDAVTGTDHGTLTNFALTGSSSNWLSGSLVIACTSIPATPSVSPQNFNCVVPVSALTPAPGTGIRWYTSATSFANLDPALKLTQSATLYVAAVNATGCESARVPVNITINATTAPPAVTPVINYIQGTPPAALTATGSGLLWYSTQTGGTGNSTAPVVNTSQISTRTYWVSQTVSGCESQRSRIDVQVVTNACGGLFRLPQNNGGHQSLAIKMEKSLWGWGFNGNGQLGMGNLNNQSIPVQTGNQSDWMSISCGSNHTVAIKNNGTLWSWGLNGDGQLGNGTNNNSNVPVQIGTQNNWAKLSCGAYHTVALKTDGTLWAWGNNMYGQLGNGGYGNESQPVQVGNQSDWASVSCGPSHTIAIKTDGTLWAWGHNDVGQLGDPGYNYQAEPVQIGSDANWASVACGGDFSNSFGQTLAIKTDGTLWAWGYNGYGQLGIGSSSLEYYPVQVGTQNDWSTVSSGATFSLAIKTNGSLWAWGANDFGQLGLGNFVTRYTPVRVGTATDWTAVSCGFYHTLAAKTNTLFAWGYNAYGQLGNGSTSNRNTPLQIAAFNPVTPQIGTINQLVTGNVVANTAFNFNLECSQIARLSSNGANPVSGRTTAKVWVETTQPALFVKRHYEITPELNASAVTGRVTLYFTQQEFDDYNSVNLVDLPTGPTDAVGKANLLVAKLPGTSNNGTGLPNTYSGSYVIINPTDADIVWNASMSRWEVSFDVNGFSGFFIKTSSSLLPLKWIAVNAELTAAKQPVITWTVQESGVQRYEVKKSTDGRSFTKIGTTNSKGDGTNNYRFTEQISLAGKAYYRIEQTDKDGTTSYSRILVLSAADKSVVSLYPNPAVQEITLNSQGLTGTSVLLMNEEGRMIKKIQLTKNSTTIDLRGFANGLYLLKLQNGETLKFIKQ